ncbi:MAG: Holliday junction branch migration DNA helicase RuvB [Candidatus Omnitrophica bacterium CG12_big_fil_rev_8_21_14_0_65_43_15]|uniref:Holliday junction branch migration complex subunit RuvB n=1 Tax=Candidatus Taenaricola geysiri TaxID=1974752 RepID=A0A2J0LEU9_9BACT|nr:MAG: Holliday junction branch migration DNA helicase RuvB [Candidatus Omnitrophica bacterium CG03_land_8_20_14_0_80_43_22]PIW66381.1 MAG: Holliday junction branch migration DNA helicase RuvB [Candidatus Omnitrophica bacterium CG12_big_fil_rev_8_21_14_0_65_43_15]PIY84401.1 MAG: Holliday junction branch migration DNA helicase RuvB [Candidatus Omnitrophica bacterium CG_4_10_14_0_8_um_filter_43_18]PJC46547.1 MAG: Holliday junction branch migration DNA helicase RuvB [Candidatus Omnitrophica bacter
MKDKKYKLTQKDVGRERLLVNQETEEDVVLNISLRPTKLGDFVGQLDIIDNLKISIEAAKKRNESLEHILFSGPPGLGKTSLAHIIAHEMGTKITATSGPAIERAGDLIGILTNLEAGDILFIDEIHRLSKVVEEFLYPAMENYQIDFVIDKGPYAKTIKFNLKKFTLIGATTRTGLLTAPMRGRFGILHHLDFYAATDLARIIKRSAKILNIDINVDAAAEIAARSRGTPRVANRLLRRVRDYAEVKSDGKITKELAGVALDAQGIDNMGLDNVDRKVLKAIIDFYKGGPVGIESLAATLNEEADTIIDVVEPFLLKIGFLNRTSRGRQATELAYKHFNLS